MGLQAGFGTVRFMEEAGLTTLLLQHRHSASDLQDAARGFFTDAPELSVIVSESAGLSELPLALQLARRHVGRPGVHQAPLADLAGIVQGLPSPGLVAMCQRLLAPLASDGGSSLRETFDAYLRHSGNSAKICDELFIHRNTLSYRLRKMEEAAETRPVRWRSPRHMHARPRHRCGRSIGDCALCTKSSVNLGRTSDMTL